MPLPLWSETSRQNPPRRQPFPHVRLLDLYCCQGGASAGYTAAGFHVTGVDLHPQPRYPYPFTRADALTHLSHLIDTGDICHYDAIHASPPCQRRSKAQRIQNRQHPALIAPTRELLIKTGLPYIIENVPHDAGEDDDPLHHPVELCGATFGLHTYRHRHFETNFPLTPPPHPPHQTATTKMGRALTPGDWYHAVGNFSNVAYIRADMGVDWMNRDGIRESIPPAYAQYVGRQLLAHLRT